MIGWFPSDLNDTGEQHAFRLEMGKDLGSGYIINCPEGFRALCGKIAKVLKDYGETEAEIQAALDVPKCEVCETLLGERGRPLDS